jgi:hypothetical protein
MAAGLALLENRPLTDSPEKNTLTQRPLRLERVKLSQDEWAVKSYVTYLLLLVLNATPLR